MTRKEAIKELSYIADEMPSMECADWREAISMVIKALEQEPCDDCISRQAVLEVQAKYAGYVGATKFWQMRDDIKELSPVTPQPKTGHWIKHTNGYNATSYICSECGHWHPLHNHTLGFRYCNWCGVKMVEPQESEDKE